MPVTLKESYGRQATLLGKETTFRTAVTAGIRPLSLKLPIKIESESEKFTPSGMTVPSVVVLNDEYTTASGTGKPDYRFLPYILRSIFGAPVTDDTIESDVVYTHAGSWDGVTELAPESYTLNYGKLGATTGRRSAGFIFTKFGFKVSRKGVDFTCAGMGDPITPAFTMPSAGSVTPVEPLIMFPKHFSLYIDDEWDDLGTTQVLSVTDFSVDMSEMLQRVMVINDDVTADGFVETEENEHTVDFTIFASADAAYLTALRTGAYKFVRLEALGGAFGSASNFTFTLDLCMAVDSFDPHGSTDNVHTVAIKGTLVNDPVSGECLSYQVINDVASY